MKSGEMTDRELMQQALDALEYASEQTKPENLYGCDCLICKTILALRNRLAQPETPDVTPEVTPYVMDEMIQTNITVTLTEKELAFRERAREAGLPTIVVSLYAGALQRLVDKERKLREKNGG